MLIRLLGIRKEYHQWWKLTAIPSSGGSGIVGLIRKNLDADIPTSHLSVNNQLLESLSQDEVLAHSSSNILTIIVSDHPCFDDQDAHRNDLFLTTTEGPDSGRLIPLARDALVVGRSLADVKINDPYLHSQHMTVQLTRDGLHVRKHKGDDHGAVWTGEDDLREGETAFGIFRGNSSPLQPPSSPEPLVLKPGHEPQKPNLVLQSIMALSPLVIGVVMVAVTGRWYFLLFSLVSVLVATVMALQHRRAKKKFGQQIATALSAYAERSESQAYSPLDLALAARSHSSDRFALLPDTPQNPVLRWGMGRRTAEIENIRDPEEWLTDRQGELSLITSLVPGENTVIIGDANRTASVARWVLIQLLRYSLTTRYAIHVVAEDKQQTFGSPEAAHRTILDLSGTLIPDDLPAPDSTHIVSLVPSHSDFSERESLRPVQYVDVDRERLFGAGIESERSRIDGISEATYRWLSDELGVSVPVLADSSAELPVPRSPEALSACSSVVIELGRGPLSMTLDVVKDGPHALITGTTGSGKSELLLTLLVGMTINYPPGEVSLLLIDFKGGSSFAVLEDLPHTMYVETNLGTANRLRSFDAIDAELRRREQLFLDSKVPDYPAYRQQYPQRHLPRLVVAVDELRILVEDYPEAVPTLMRLATTGRSLGFHLVLSTQRAQGAVSSDIRSNIGIFICLRAATEQDSWDMLNTDAAQHISQSTPGRAYLRRGGQPPKLFQTGTFSLPSEEPLLTPVDHSTDQQSQTSEQSSSTDWPELVEFIHQHWCDRTASCPDPVILPELPETLTAQQFQRRSLTLAYVDRPARREQFFLTWTDRPGKHPQNTITQQSVAWVGTNAGGLRDAGLGILKQLESAQATVTILDGDQWCVQHSDLEPTLVAQCSDQELLEFLEALSSELDEGSPVVLVISNWGKWATHRVGSTFESFEEHLIRLVRDYPQALQVFIFGGKELAGGRLIGLIQQRFYIPQGTTPEHRIVWPNLITTRQIHCRAVMISSDHPAPGLACQLPVLG